MILLVNKSVCVWMDFKMKKYIMGFRWYLQKFFFYLTIFDVSNYFLFAPRSWF